MRYYMCDSLLGMKPALGWNSWNTFTWDINRSEEHTSELQSHPENSYVVFCLKKK